MRSCQPLFVVVAAAALCALMATPGWAQTAEQSAAPKVEKASSQAPKPAATPQPAAASASAPSAAPAALPKDWNANIRVDVTITDAVRGGSSSQKSISVTVRNDGRGSVRSGVSFPVPSTTFTPVATGGPGVNPMTSFQYRDMGLSLDVTSATIQDNFVKLRIAVEYNPVDEKTANAEGANVSAAGQAMASFAQFRQTLDVVLENGKPLVVATASDPVPSRERKASLEVKATILR